MELMNITRPLLFVILLNGISIVVLFFFFNALSIPDWIPCIYHLSQSLAFALVISLFIHLLSLGRIWLTNSRLIVLIYSLLLLFTLWLGSYPYSPLGFSAGHIPVLQRFEVTRLGRPAISVRSGAIVTIARDSVAEITPLILPVDLTCTWMSTNGGTLEDPRSCDTAYLSPGGADYDILKLLIQPACHLPDALGEIRISVLP